MPKTDSKSYKLDLSHLNRDGSVSITQQLVDLFTAADRPGASHGFACSRSAAVKKGRGGGNASAGFSMPPSV